MEFFKASLSFARSLFRGPADGAVRLGFANGRHMSSAAELTAANVLGLVVMRCFKRTLSGGAVGAGRLQPLTDLWRGA